MKKLSLILVLMACFIGIFADSIVPPSLVSVPGVNFTQFVQAHWGLITTIGLFVWSEILGSNPKIKSNSLYQLISSLFQKQDVTKP